MNAFYKTVASVIAIVWASSVAAQGAAPLSDGPYVRRVLCVEDTANLVDKLAGLSARERAKLPGVSARRAPQLLAGAIVAATTMALLDVDELLICPWALREGVFLTRQDWIVAL